MHQNSKWLILVFCSCLFLFLTRYIGAFSFLLVGMLSIWFFLKKNYPSALRLFLVTVILVILASLYLYYNYLQTGFVVGVKRIALNEESFNIFFNHLITGLTNELFIYQKHYFKVRIGYTFLVLVAIQVLIMALLIFEIGKTKTLINFKEDSGSILWGTIGLAYLAILVVLRWFSPSFPFDYRLLSPFTLCLFTAVLQFFGQPFRAGLYAGMYKYIIILFSVSLLVSLPKTYLLKSFQGLFS